MRLDKNEKWVSCLLHFFYDTDQHGAANVFFPLAPGYIAMLPRAHTDTLSSGTARDALNRERDRDR